MPRRRPANAVAYPRDDPALSDRVNAIAEVVSAEHGLAESARRWAPFSIARGDLPAGAPTLSLDDYSGIPFVKEVLGVAWYQYRARLRCGDGDLYAVARPEIDGYEEYNRAFLGLGRTTAIHIEPEGSGLEIARALREDAVLADRLADVARSAGGLLIHPYMAIRPVWELAEALDAAAGVPVRVQGPLPDITRLANDKACLSEIVEGLLGPDSLTHTETSDDPAGITALTRQLAERCDAVALKMPSCASGMGNRIFDAGSLLSRSQRETRDMVDAFLREKEWDGREEVLVVEWHRDVLESPSTQCWIPPLGRGEPIVEEVYEQLLVGEQKVFEGALLSALPAAIRRDFMTRSWLVCRVLQRLGYVGRCSFDGLVVGPDLDRARVKFVECNARWGGTSTPMHLMTRVFGDFRAVPYRAQDYVDPRLLGLSFHELMELFGDTLYDRRTGRGRVLLYNPGGVTDHGKFDIVVTGRTYPDIARFISDRIPALIDRYVTPSRRSY